MNRKSSRVLENLANKEVASKSNISERTAKVHVSNLLAKSGVRRRATSSCFPPHPEKGALPTDAQHGAKEPGVSPSKFFHLALSRIH